MKCTECKFFNVLPGNAEDAATGQKVVVGQCRFNAPIPVAPAKALDPKNINGGMPPIQMGLTAWPIVNERDWCGAFQPKLSAAPLNISIAG